MVLAGAGLVALMDNTPIGSAPGTSFLLPADAPADQTCVHACLLPAHRRLRHCDTISKSLCFC